MEVWGSDANGNTIAEQEKAYTDGRESSNMSISGRIGGSSLKVYKYDAFNRLVQYNDSASEAAYTYGADNLRASKTVNGVKTDFVWNGQNLAGEFRRDTVNTYTYDITGIHMANQNGTVASYIKDYHGNIVAKADTSGNMIDAMIDRRDYDAFGNHRNGAEADPFGYCGEYYDNESGLIYLRNRYYNSAIGRFITEDPIKDGLNWYSYCYNKPLQYVDKNGLKPGDDKRDAQDLYEVAEQVTNIVANQIYWPISDAVMQGKRKIWANEARTLLKAYVNEEFKDEGLATLINEVIDDGTINGVEENSSLLCVVAYYMDQMSNRGSYGLGIDVSYETLRNVYDTAVEKGSFFYIDASYVSSDINDLIKKYVGEKPSIRPGGTYIKNGKSARKAFEFPFDTVERNYGQ